MWIAGIIILILLFYPLRINTSVVLGKNLKVQVNILPFPFFKKKFQVFFIEKFGILDSIIKNIIDGKDLEDLEIAEEDIDEILEEKGISVIIAGLNKLKEVLTMFKEVIEKLVSKLNFEIVKLHLNYGGPIFIATMSAGTIYASLGIILGIFSTKARKFPAPADVLVNPYSKIYQLETEVQFSTNLLLILSFLAYLLWNIKDIKALIAKVRN